MGSSFPLGTTRDMKQHHRRQYLVSLTICAVLVLSGCESKSSNSALSTSTTAGSEATKVRSPLERFLNNSVPRQASSDPANASMRQAEEEVARCMSEQGFRYTPRTFSDDSPSARIV